MFQEKLRMIHEDDESHTNNGEEQRHIISIIIGCAKQRRTVTVD